MVSGVRGLLGALVTGAVGVLVLISCGTSSEGTVVAKADQGVYDYACQAGGTVTDPVGVPHVGNVFRPRVLAAGRPRQRRQHVQAVRKP